MVTINSERCIGCGNCAADCPDHTIELVEGKAHVTGRLCLDCGHCMAICPVHAITMDGYDSSEVLEALEVQQFHLDPEQYLRALKFRRSIRRFRRKPAVTQGQLHQILEAGRYAPSGCNRQAMRVLCIQEKLPQVTELALKALSDDAQQQEKSGGDKAPFRSRLKDWYQSYVEQGTDPLFFRAPLVLALVGDPQYSIDAGIMGAHMELMTQSLGLGACFIGFFCKAVSISPALRELLGLQEQEQVLASLAIGQPLRKYCRTVNRKPTNLTVL